MGGLGEIQRIFVNLLQLVFDRIWWINEFGGLTGYSLVLVHYWHWN